LRERRGVKKYLIRGKDKGTSGAINPLGGNLKFNEKNRCVLRGMGKDNTQRRRKERDQKRGRLEKSASPNLSKGRGNTVNGGREKGKSLNIELRKKKRERIEIARVREYDVL